MDDQTEAVVIEPPFASAAKALPESTPIWKATEGQIVNARWMFLSLVGFWLLVPVLWTAWRMIRTACHTYTLTTQRFRERSGVLAVQVDELELYRVKDIAVHQPFVQRLLGRGQIVLLTSDRSTPRVVLNAIPAPAKVADLIRAHVELCRVQKGVREID